MSKDQIKQNAEAYAELLTVGNKEHYRAIYTAAKEGYETGAYSRDEEIEHKNTAIKELGKVCGDLLIENLNLKTNLYKLQNPWISVKDHLPEMFVDSKGITHDFSVKVIVTNENNPNYWYVAEYYPNKNEWCCLEHPTSIMDNVTHWMPISKLN